MERTIQSSIKRQKVSDGEQNKSLIDRISALPDDVLCHILSFLPTKFSVSTSILARRWRFLWTHVPNLNFGIETLFLSRRKRFSEIITRVMFLHKVQSLNTFRLSRFVCCSEHEIETWITNVMSRHVKNLVINLGNNHIKFYECLFTSKILVDLRLDCCLFFHLNGTVCLPSLKKLHLCSIQLDGDETLPHLISGCPVLEELIIEKIINQKMVSFSISSPTIKRLKVDFQLGNRSIIWRSGCRLQIDCPALRYLQLQLCLFDDLVSAQKLTSLIEADIRYKVHREVEDDYDNLYVLNFIDTLCNVNCLKFSSAKSFTNRPFVDQGRPIRRFNNLTKLELVADWFFLVKFLENAENLEVLIIREGHGMHKKPKNWIEPFQQVPKCISSHLRTITIDRFGFTEPEFNMVRYILRNAEVLNKMEIYFIPPSGPKVKNEALKRISLFHRGSEACQLVIYRDPLRNKL